MLYQRHFLRQSPSILHLWSFGGRVGVDGVLRVYFVDPIMTMARKRTRTAENPKKQVNIPFRHHRTRYTVHPPNRTHFNTTPTICTRWPGHGMHPHRDRPARSDRLPPQQRQKIYLRMDFLNGGCCYAGGAPLIALIICPESKHHWSDTRTVAVRLRIVLNVLFGGW